MYINKLLILFFTISISIISQPVSVSGKVTSNRYPIHDVLITLIDNADTTLQYSTVTDNSGRYQIGVLTEIDKVGSSVPTSFQLGQSYPNPFSSITSIPYGLEKESNIVVVIYDILGREVKKFKVGRQSIGTHHLAWDGSNNLGQKVASGIFFYRFIVNGESHVRKMIFNQSGSRSVALPHSFYLSRNKPMQKKNQISSTLGTDFTIRIQNTENTLPLIVENGIESVSIQNDTIINFDVTSVPTALINIDSTHQFIQGYGAASPWYLPAMTDSEVGSAFGMDAGQIGFTIFRLTIEPDSNSWSKYIPSAKRAYEMGAKIIASPWHAPYDMRETIGSDYRVRYDMYDEYVDHLNHFVQYMSDNGVPVYGISIQNEPDIGDWTQWTIDEMLTFMRDYAHAIEGTKVMSPESYHFNRDYSDPILNDSAAAANTDIVIGHIYGGGLFSYPLAEEKGKEVWMTEYLMGENNSGNNLYWTIELAKNINSVMRANMNAYVWWTIVRYYGPIGDGQTASNPEDPRERYPAKGEVTKKGFALSQFSKFIRPGFIRVESKEYPSTSNIFISAYKNPENSNIVVVMINDNDTEVKQYIRLKGLGTTTFATYTTSETKNCERGDDVNVSNGLSFITLEPYSIVTFISE